MHRPHEEVLVMTFIAIKPLTHLSIIQLKSIKCLGGRVQMKEQDTHGVWMCVLPITIAGH